MVVAPVITPPVAAPAPAAPSAVPEPLAMVPPALTPPTRREPVLEDTELIVLLADLQRYGNLSVDDVRREVPAVVVRYLTADPDALVPPSRRSSKRSVAT